MSYFYSGPFTFVLFGWSILSIHTCRAVQRVGQGRVCAQPEIDSITSGFPCPDPLPTGERSRFGWSNFHRVPISPRLVLGCEKICRILPKAAELGETWLDLDEI